MAGDETADLSLFVDDVDQAEIAESRHRNLGQPVQRLGEPVASDTTRFAFEEELESPLSQLERRDQGVTLGRLFERVQDRLRSGR